MATQNKYQIEVSKLKAELALAKAKADYFTYLTVDCDLYDKAAESIMFMNNPPSSMTENEAIECRKHITKIKNAESKFYAFA